jgi:predicted glycoside hydrolase/deacetylase ChbG (UPF0249 family)
MIKLIINADDFGYSKVFNEKILELLEKGFIKSTTVLVNRIAESQKGQIKRLIELSKTGKITVGLHTDFNLEEPLNPQMEEQYKIFISIFGFKPTHIDIHKFMEHKPIEAMNQFAEKHNLPVRNCGIKANTKQTTYPAFFCTDWILKLDKVLDFLKTVKDGSSCELITHPGKYDPNCKSSLNKEREIDFEVIIKIQKFLESNRNIRNVSYLEL